MELMKDPELLSPESCSGVLVFAEQRGGELSSVTLELLGKGRVLADALGQELEAALFGSGVDALAEELRHYGVDRVLVVDNETLAHFQDQPYSAALCKLVRQTKPSILLAGATNIGRSFMPAVAARLGVSLTAGCSALAIDPESKGLIATRPAFGGTVYADIAYVGAAPQIATVRRKMFDPAQRSDEATGEIVAIELPGCAAAPKTRFLESVNELAGAIDLTEADVIVTGGRGIGGPEGFELIKGLADAMGGVVGASRQAVDSGWIAYSHQVGQTGKTVKPKIYVACGVSGAIQHLIGMRNSDMIIAINRDPDAPIFNVATFGLVGDVKQVIPALIERFSRGA